MHATIVSTRSGQRPAPTTESSLWHHRDFRRLWISDSVSQFGTFGARTLLPILAATALAATPFQMGLLAAAEHAAFLLIGLPAGVWVDRMRRRPLMIKADLARALLLATVPLAWWAGALTMPHLLGVALLLGVCTLFFDVAYQSYLPFLVGRAKLMEGNAKLQVSQSTAVVTAPGAAGGLAQVAGAAGAVLLTGAGYALSALALVRIKAVEPPVRPVREATLRADVAEGLRFVFGNRTLRAIVACTASGNLAGGAFTAIEVLFLLNHLHLPVGGVGAVLAAGGAGGVLAAVVAERLTRHIGQARAIWLIPVLTFPANFLVALAEPGWRVGLAVTGMFIFGFGVVVYNVAQVSYRQAICPDRLLGRMNASIRCVVWGTMPIGGLLGGLLGEWLGVRGAVWATAAAETAAALWVVCSPLRHMRDVPDGPAES